MPSFPVPDAPEVKVRGANIIAICNHKGGVGKTTSTINLGATLVEYGHKVLLVDFDPQGAVAVGFGINPNELERTVYNLLRDPQINVDEVMLNVLPGLDLMPSNTNLSALKIQLYGVADAEAYLALALKPILYHYDDIIIDCDGYNTILTRNVLKVAHSVIVPFECEFLALRSIDITMAVIDDVLERSYHSLNICGLLATRYDVRIAHSREILARAVQKYGNAVFHTVIEHSELFAEASVAGEPITIYAPDSRGSADYRQLAREMLNRSR